MGFGYVPGPPLHQLQSLTPRLVNLVLPCPLVTHPLAEQDALLAVIVRNPRVPLTLDEPLQQPEVELPRGRRLLDEPRIERIYELGPDLARHIRIDGPWATHLGATGTEFAPQPIEFLP